MRDRAWVWANVFLIPANQPATRNNQPKQPTKQPTNEFTNQPTNQRTYQPAGQPTNPSTNLPTNQPANQPTNLPTNQPTNQTPNTHNQLASCTGTGTRTFSEIKPARAQGWLGTLTLDDIKRTRLVLPPPKYQGVYRSPWPAPQSTQAFTGPL